MPPTSTPGGHVDFANLTAAADAMRKLADSAADPKPAPAGAVPGNTPATQKAAEARQSYQKTARWMLAAFATVGVLIFGSLPFAAMADVDLTWPRSLWLIGGLAVAVAGIVTAVIAVSLVSEPEDVSLGELDNDLRSLQKTDEKGFLWINNKPVLKVNKLATLWNPKLAARVALVKILHGEDSSAHLGPNLGTSDRPASVTDLIRKLGALESHHATLAPTVAKHKVAVDSYEKRTADLAKLLEELRASNKDTGTVTTAITGRNDGIRRMEDSIEAWDMRLELRRTTLTRQFTALEVALSQMAGQSSWLAGQIGTLSTSSGS